MLLCMWPCDKPPTRTTSCLYPGGGKKMFYTQLNVCAHSMPDWNPGSKFWMELKIISHEHQLGKITPVNSCLGTQSPKMPGTSKWVVADLVKLSHFIPFLCLGPKSILIQCQGYNVACDSPHCRQQPMHRLVLYAWWQWLTQLHLSICRMYGELGSPKPGGESHSKFHFVRPALCSSLMLRWPCQQYASVDDLHSLPQSWFHFWATSGALALFWIVPCH